MADTEWIDNIKRIVRQAEASSGPCDVLPGTVEGISPLAVRIDQKLILTGPQLFLPESLTDHEVTMVLPEHGESRVMVKNALKAGDRVLLIQKRGAQQYLVLDRW